MAKFLNVSTDNTLGGVSPSDNKVSSEKAVKQYIDSHTGATTLGGLTDVVLTSPSQGQNLTYDATNNRWINTSTSATVAWGGITGDITNQTDLQNALGGKVTALSSGPTAGTYTKVTINSDGLVTAGASLQASDIPDISETYYLASNPSGYTSNIGTVTSINNTTPDASGNVSIAIPSINSTNNYVPYRSSASAFSNSTLMYNSNAMAFTGRLHVGSASPASYYDKGRLTIYDNTASQQTTSLALLNYGGGGGCGVAIDMYNTSANSGIPSGRFGLIDNGNYSGYLQLQVKKSGASNNPLLPAMNIVAVPATNSLTTCVSFGQDEFNRVLFDLHKPEATVTITDSDKRWGGSGTTYSVTGSNKFNSRLLVAVGDIVSFDNFTTEATVTGVVSNSTTCQITTDISLGTISNKNISVKKAYFKVTDEVNNTKIIIDPYGKMGIGKLSPSYDLDVAGNINASTDIKINGSSVALASSVPTKISDLTDDTSTNPVDKADTLTGLTASITELNYTDGVTSGIQSQLDSKVNVLTTQPTAGTYPKVTINSDGLVTAGASLVASDIPDISGTYYLASNPSGYTSNVGTVTSVNSTTPDASGNVEITIPTVNNATLTITQNGTSAGTFTANSSTDTTIALTDTTYTFSTGLTESSGTVTVTDYNELLKNTATGTDGLTIGGTASSGSKSINIGVDSTASSYSRAVAVGAASKVTGNHGVAIGTSAESAQYSIALGEYAVSSAKEAYQIGHGTNSTAFSLSVGFYQTGYSTPIGNYQLLDGMTGLIPDARLSSNIARTSDITVTDVKVNNTSVVSSGVASITVPTKISDLTDDTATYPVDKADTLTGLTATVSELNIMDGVTATASEINVLDGITATTTELNYVDGVTSSIQTQLDNKLAKKPDGTNNLIDSGNKVSSTYLPDYLLGQMLYAGNFVPSTAVATLSTNAKTKLGTTSNTITLTNDTTAITGYVANEGCYYICTADGTFASISFVTGDWLVSTGSAWTKIDNTDAVTGVKGNAESTYRTGNVNITADNVLPSQSSNSGKYLTTNGTTASWGSITIPTVNNSTITIQKNSTTVDTFTLNQSSNQTIDISVPTKISDLTDDTSTYPVDKADTLTGLTATVTELNVLDGITASTTELNYVDGVTSNIQTQLDSKASTSSISNMVTTDTNQTITGYKTFNSSNGRVGIKASNMGLPGIHFSNDNLGNIGQITANTDYLTYGIPNSNNSIDNHILVKMPAPSNSQYIPVGSTTLPVYLDSTGNPHTITSYEGTSARATGDKNGDDITTKYVTVDTTQTISGTKTFSNGTIKISNSNGGVNFQTTDGTNFIRRNGNDGTLVLIGQGTGILLKPNGDNDSTTQATVGSDGTITAVKFSGPLEGTATRATGDKNGNDITTKYVTVDTAQTISETKTFTAQQKFQDGNGTGCMIIGADVATNTVTEGVRKLGRIVFHTKDSNAINCVALNTDTNCIIDGVTNDNINCVEIGGRVLDETNTSPDRIGFTVATVKNTLNHIEKLLVCDMNKDAVSFYAQPKYNGDNLVVESTLNKGFVADGSVQSDSAGYNRINYYNNLSYDASKFTEHGNIVVTDGVVSNFSTSNYIYTTIGKLPASYSTFEIHFGKFNFSSFSMSGGSDWVFTNALPLSSGGIQMRPSAGTTDARLRFWVGESGSWNIFGGSDGNINHINDIGKNIEVKLVFDGSKYTISSSVDGGSWQTEREITSSLKMAGDLPFYFGGVTNVDQHTTDLKAFKIIADGTLIFTGEQVGTASYNLSGSTVNIPYKVTPIGRIVDSVYRTNLSSVLSTYGYVPYYTIDTTNSNYTLPQGEIYGVTTMMAKQAVTDAQSQV